MSRESHCLWLKGDQTEIGNGVLLSKTRVLCARSLLLTYHDAALTCVEAAVHGREHIVASSLLKPAECLLTNQTLDFSIVAVDEGFCHLSGLQPVSAAEGHVFEEGQFLQLLCGTRDADTGSTQVVALVVDEFSENEVLVHAERDGGVCALGSPVYNHAGSLVAMVVKKPNGPGLRAVRLSAIFDRLRKRGQLSEALNEGVQTSGAVMHVSLRRRPFLKRLLVSMVGSTLPGATMAMVAAVVSVLVILRRRR